MRGIQFFIGCAFGFVFFFLALWRDRKDELASRVDLAFTLDEDFKIRGASPALLARLGYKSDEVDGMSILKLVHTNDSQTVRREFKQARNESFGTRWEARLCGRNDAVVEFQWNLQWLRRDRQFSCVLYDLEEIKAVASSA